MNRDRMLRLLPLAGKDIAAVELFINLGQQFEITEPEAAKIYYQEAGSLSWEIN